MDNDNVVLYTTDSFDDQTPKSFSYPLDISGQECLNIAMENIGLIPLPGYNLLLRTNRKNSWLDLQVSLRAQDVQTGDMIIILPSFFELPDSTANLNSNSSLYNSTFESDSSFYNPSTFDSNNDSHLVPSPMTDMLIKPSQLDPGFINNPSPLIDPEFNMNEAYESIPAPQLPSYGEPIKIEAINMDEIGSMSDEDQDTTNSNSNSTSNSNSSNEIYSPKNLLVDHANNSGMINDSINNDFASSGMLTPTNGGVNSNMTNNLDPNLMSSMNSEPISILMDSSTLPSVRNRNRTVKFQSGSGSDNENADVDLYIGDDALDLQTHMFDTFRNFEKIETPKKKEKDKEAQTVALATFEGFSNGGSVFTYDTTLPFERFLNEAIKNLNIERQGRYTILVKRANEKKIFGKDQFLEELLLQNQDSVHLFKCENKIKIDSSNFVPEVMTLDLSKTVDDLCADIGKHFGFEGYLTYNLYSTEGDILKPLDGNLTVLEQTENIKRFTFQKQYYIFSGEDLFTFDTAKIAIHDAMRQLPKDDVELTEEEAAKVLIFYAIANKERYQPVDYYKYANKGNTYLPDSCKDMKLIPKIKSMHKAYKKLDPFNAIRQLLNFLRHKQGFGCYNFTDSRVEIKYKGKKTRYPMIIQVAPYSLRFIRPVSNVLEERISYSKIFSNELLGERLQLQFTTKKEVAKYTIIGPDSARIKFLMEQHMLIIRKIQHKRAIERASKFGGAIIDQIDERDKVELITATGFNDKEPKRIPYDLKMDGKIALQCAEQNLGIPHSDDNVMIIRIYKEMFQWASEGKMLRMLKIQNDMHAYLLRNNRPIRFHFSDGHTTKIIIDITRPIEELVNVVFHNLKIAPMLGYTFYSLEDPKNPKPLDSRFTIPEVCRSWDDLLFKRRFFVISGEVLTNAFSAQSTFADCQEQFLKGGCNVTDDQIIDFAIMAHYAVADDAANVKNTKITDWSKEVPQGFKVTKKFQNKFYEALKNSSPMDRFTAARSYLGKVRKLKEFGIEKFDAQYTDLTPPPQKEKKDKPKGPEDVILVVGPLRLIILQQSPKGEIKVLKDLSYRFIVTIESLGNRMIIRHINSEDLISGFELKVKNSNTALMLINYNIKIIHDLMLAKQRKRKAEAEENAKRLAGGYIDENGIIRTRMMDFYVSKDLTKTDKLPKIWLELEKTGNEVVDILTPIMKLNPEIEWVILMRLVRKEWAWILEDKTLESAEPERLSTIFVLEAYPMIEVKFSMGMTKTMKLPIFKKVSELVQIIADKLNLKSSIGFTLYLLKDEDEPLPLDANITLPEQTPIYDRLFFKRRFFVISKFDIDDGDSLYQLFCDVRALVHSGQIEMASENALKLMYYELKVDYPLPLTKESIPKDHENYLPIGMKPKEKVSKFIQKMMEDFPVKDKRDAMIEYIRIARTLPTFGSEKYDVDLVEEKKDTVERNHVFIYVGPYKIFIKDESQKKQLFSISYKHLLGVNNTDQEFCIRYHNNEDIRIIEKIHLESPNSSKISGFILSYLQTYFQIILKRIQTNDETQPTDRIELKTVFGYDIENFVKCTYDIRWNGKEVIESACRGLELDSDGQYSCLLRKSDEDFEWVEPDTILGTLNPTFALYVHIYHEFMPVSITTPITKYQRLMYLKVTRKVKKLIDEIAFKMFIDDPSGYTLYYEHLDKLIPLDLMDPIPFQVIDFSKLIFKRRFLVFTKNDVRSQITSTMIYPDVKERFASGKTNLSNNRMLELVGYQLIAESPPELEVQMIQIPQELDAYIPENFVPKQDFRDKLRTALNARASAKTSRIKAGQAFIVGASKTKYFGCEFYDCYEFRKEGAFMVRPKKRILKIAIGPNSLSIYDPQTNKDVIYSPHKNIVSCHLIKNNVIIQITSKAGTKEATLDRVVIASDSAAAITSLILNYRHVVLPNLDKRESIQKLPEVNEQFHALIDPNFLANDFVNMKVSRQLEHTKPPLYTISKKYNVKDAISVGLYRISYPNKGEYMILTSKERKRYDNQYVWLSVDDDFTEGDIYDNAHLFVMLKQPYCQVIGENMHIKENYVDMKTIILDLCKNLVEEFGFGNYLGYTLYEFWEGKQRPLDFLYNIPTNMENYIEVVLRRRFFLFTKDLLSDDDTLRASFRAVKNQVLSGTMNVPDDTAAELAIYALYYSAYSSSDVLPFTSTANEQKIQPLLPVNIKASPNIVKKFTALGSVIKPLEPLEAAMKYIILANTCLGFGMEEYQCFYSEVNNFSMTNVDALIRLCPYYISCVYNDKNQNEIARFGWNSIVEYKRDDTVTKVKYQNDNSLFVSIELLSDKDCREIFSFINDMMDLFARHDFSHLGELTDEKFDNEFNFDDINFDMGGDDQFNYDDLNAIQVYQNDQEFEIGRNADDDTIYFLEDTAKLGKIEDNEWKWRATDDGLMMTRAANLLDNITRDLDLTSLDNISMDDLTNRIDLLDDELKRFDFDDDTKNTFLNVEGCLESLRDSALTAEDEQGQSRLSLLLNSINLCQAYIDDKTYIIKAQVEEPLYDIEETNSPSTTISYNLLGASQMMENMLNTLNIKMKELEPLSPKYTIVKMNLIQRSETATKICAIILKNKDPAILPQLINPLLIQMKNEEIDLKELIVTAKDNGEDVTDLQGLLDDFNKLLQNLEISPALQSNANLKTTKYVLMLGDIRGAPLLVKALEDTNEAMNELKDIDPAEFDPQLFTNLQLLQNNIQLNVPYISDRVVTLQANPLNDTAKSEVLRALADLQESLALCQPYLEAPEVQNNEKLQLFTKLYFTTFGTLNNEILKISTTNITPNNIQAIEIDLNNLINRHAGLEIDAKDKIHDKDPEVVDNALKTLRDSRFLISGLQSQLQSTPASGELIAKLQKLIFDLDTQLPQIKDFGYMVQDVSNDVTYPVLVESLEANIKNALTETPPTEDINQCPHLARFRQLQIDTGRLLNQIKAALDSSSVRSDLDLHERISNLYTRVMTNYGKQIELRRLIQAHPYDKGIIDRTIELVADLDNTTNKLLNANVSIQDPSTNILLSNLLNLLLKDIKLCDASLRSAPLEIFHEPPSEDLVNELDLLLNGLINYLAPQIDSNLSRGNMVTYFLDLQSKVKTLIPVVPNYLHAGRLQTNEFFTMTPNIKDMVDQIKDTTDQISSLSDANQYITRLNIIFNQLIRGSDATYDVSFELLQSTVDSLTEFGDLCAKLALTPEISEEAKTLLNDLSLKAGNLKTSLIMIINSKNPDNLEHAKDLILQFRALLAQVPGQIRAALSPDDFSKIVTVISFLTMRSNYAVACIRHLPSQKKLLIDNSKFKRITKDDEIDDCIPIVKDECDEMKYHIEQLLSYPPLKDKKATLEMLEKMKRTFDPLDDYMDGMDEKDLLKLLVDLNNSKIFMKESCILVAPVVDDPELMACERIRSDNVTVLMRAIQAPHLTFDTSIKMLEELRPQLQVVDPLLSEFKERDDVVNQKEFKDLLDSYYILVTNSISNLLTNKKVEQQKIVDDLYRDTSVILPILMDNPDYGDFQTEVTTLFEILSKYTSLPLLSIRFTTPLQVKKELYSVDSCKELLTKTMDQIGSNTTLLSPELADGLNNIINSQLSSPESIPRYLGHVSRLLFTTLSTRNLLYASIAVRAVLSGLYNRNEMYELLEYLIIQTARRASIQLDLVQQPFNELSAEFAEKKESFTDKQQYWLAHSSKSLKSMDTTLLIQCPSIPTFVFDYVPMHKIEKNLLILSDSVNRSNLYAATKNYNDWLFQCDMAAIAFFMAHMDQIACTCDDLLSEDLGKNIASLKDFVRSSANALKEIDRCVFYNASSLSILAKLYIHFSGKLYEELKTIFSHEKISSITSSVDSLNRIKPVIVYWANHFDNIDDFHFTSIIQSCAAPIVSRTGDIQASGIISTNENAVAFDIAPGNSELTTINKTIQSGVESNILKADKLGKIAEKANVIAFETIARPPYKNVQVSKELGRLGKVMTTLLEKLGKHHTIDYTRLPSDALYERGEEGFLDEIKDKNVKDWLREIRKYLKKLQAMKLSGMLRSNLESRVLSSSENEHKYPDLIDPILLLTDCDTRGIPSVDLIREKPKFINEDINTKFDLVSLQETENASFKNLQNTLLTQRLTLLKQQQVLEFPIVLSRLAQIEQEEKVRIGKEEIIASFDFIVKQFDKLNEKDDLKDLQKNYIPDQILIQQIILTKMIRDQQSNPASASKFSKRISKGMESLLESAIEQLKTSTAKTTTTIELNAMLNRGFCHITLINQLIQLLQLIIAIDPDIIKFAQSPEGQEALTAPLPIEQIAREQGRIIQEIQLTSKPDLLYSVIQLYMHPKIVIKMRVIISLLNILTSEESEDLMTRNTIIPTVNDILDYAITQQNLIIQSRTDQEGQNSLIDTELITKSQQAILNLTLRTSLLYRLLTAKDMQLLLNPNCITALHGLRQKLSLSDDEIDIYKGPIMNQVLSSQLVIEDVKNISLEDMIGQQLMLIQLSALIASGAVNLKLNLKASLHATLRAIQPQQIAEMSSNKEAFTGLKPIHHPYYSLDSFLIQNHFQNKLHNIYSIRESLVKLELQFPELQNSLGELNVEKYSDKELALLRSQTANIVSKHISSDSTVIQSIESLKPQEADAIHSLLLSVEHLITIDEKKDLSRFDCLANHIFDLECTRQILSEADKGRKEQHQKDKLLAGDKDEIIEEEEEVDDSEDDEEDENIVNGYLNMKEFNKEIKMSQRAIIASRILYEISTLAKRRAELCSKLTHKDAGSKVGEISEKKLTKLILSLKEQYESGEDLAEYLEPLTIEQLITQQLLLQSFIQQLTIDTFIQNCGIELDLMNKLSNAQLVPLFFDALLHQASTNPNALRTLQTPDLNTLVHICDLIPYHIARVTLYNKIIVYTKNFIRKFHLNKKFSHLSPIKQANITDTFYEESELVPIHELLRVSLSLKASGSEIKFSHAISESIDESSKNFKYLRALNAVHNLGLQFKPTQLYFSLSEANSAKAKTEFGYRPFNMEIDQSLIKTISNPTSIEKQELHRLQVLLQNLPNDDELHQRLIQMVKSVFTIAPTMLNLPVDEVRNLLISLTRKSINLLTQIYNIENIDYFPEQLNNMIQSGSQLTSLIIALLFSVPNSVSLRPVDVLIYISNLSINCISIDQEANNQEFRYNLITFLNELKKLEASLLPYDSRNEFINSKLDTYSSLARSIKSRDVNSANFIFTDFNAASVTSQLFYKQDLNDKKKDKEKVSEEIKKEEELSTKGAKIQESIVKSYRQSLRLITHGDQLQSLIDFHTLLVKRITNATTNPYELIRSLTTLNDVRAVINKYSEILDKSLSRYIIAVRSQTESESLVAKAEFHKILNSISLAQAATLRGFQIENKKTFSFFSDAITMFSASFAGIINLADMKAQNTRSTAQIRRTVRAINRTISQLSDELSYAEIEDELIRRDKKKKLRRKIKQKKKEAEAAGIEFDEKSVEINEESSEEKPNSPIEESRLLFIKILTGVAMFVSCTGSAFASSKVPETRVTFIKGEETNYKEMLSDLGAKTTDINKLNTDRDAAEDFNNELTSLLDTLNGFFETSSISNFKEESNIESIEAKTEDDKLELQKQNPNDIAIVTSKLVTLNNLLSHVAVSASKMTDITPLVPDILNADRLRKKFSLPPVPNDTFNLKIQDAVDPISAMIDEYNKKISSVFEMLNGSGEGENEKFVNNATIAQAMNDAGDCLYGTLEQILRASTVVVNVESQNEMTSSCSNIATSFNKLLQMLRSKFLLRPDDWNKKSSKYYTIITKYLEKALKEAKKAKKVGMKEQEHSSLLQRLKMTFEKLLAARGALQVIHERIFAKSKSIAPENDKTLSITNLEWAMRVSEIGIEQASATLDCMFRYKDNPEEVSNLDQLLIFADSLANECNNGQKNAEAILANEDTTLNNSSESKESANLKGIEAACKLFIEKGGEGTPEEAKLKEILKVRNESIRSAINSLKASSESKDLLVKIMANTKESNKKHEHLNSLSTPLNTVQPRKLMIKDELLKRLQLETNVVEARIKLNHAEKVLGKK